MKNLPKQHVWLAGEPAPRMLLEALKLYGIREILGKQHNAVILSWAKELGISKIYTNDEMAWCSLAMAIIAQRAGKPMPFKGYEILRAASWATWGELVPKGQEMLGDILVFKRPGGYHVGLYIGEDSTCFHVAGGNQGNEYNICRIEKSRLYACRRYYSIGMPANVRKIYLSSAGVVSKNEK